MRPGHAALRAGLALGVILSSAGVLASAGLVSVLVNLGYEQHQLGLALNPISHTLVLNGNFTRSH